MYSIDLNYTFEINSNDLLLIKDEYLYLKILFSAKGNKIWRLGKIFSLKYQFIFNPESKQIGFYKNIKQVISSVSEEEGKNKKIEKEKEGNPPNYLIYKVILVIILVIAFTFLFMKYYKIICNLKRQKRKNEITLINDNKINSDNNLKEMENINDGNIME